MDIVLVNVRTEPAWAQLSLKGNFVSVINFIVLILALS